MKKKKPTREEKLSNYYDLKTKAVDDLVDAQAGDAPAYSEEELRRYRSGSRIRIPLWAKLVFIKAWFAGAVCFFFLWGLGTYIGALLDMLFVLGVAMGIVTDLLTNNVIRFLAETPQANDGWMMFPKKKYSSFFFNILYSFLILLCVYFTYNAVNYAIITATGAVDTIPIGVEPILFGLLCMGYDQLFIGIKRLLRSIVADAKNNARRDL